MNMLSPHPHAWLDYGLAAWLIASPWLFGFVSVSATATTIMVFLGVALAVLSLLTDYSRGVIQVLPFRTHGMMETLGAIVLMLSPWLLGFNAESGAATMVAVLTGLVWVMTVVLTDYTDARHQRTP